MRYSYEQGVEKHPEGLSRSLIVGLPVVFAAMILAPLKLGHSPSAAPQPAAHNTATVLKQPFNLRSSGNTGSSSAFTTPSGQTAAYTAGAAYTGSAGSGSSAPTSTNSGTNSSGTTSSSTAPTSGGMGGGSTGSGGTTSSSGPIPTTGVTIPGTSVTVDDKPILTTSGLTLTLN